MKKLYSNDISPRCEYCEYGVTVEGDREVLCRRKGIMQPDYCCKKFRYDPLKRKPNVRKIDRDFSAEDFSL